MANFFKNAGKGLINILILPLFLIVAVFYSVITLFGFLFLSIKGLILFFTGRNLFDDFKEDKQAKEILKNRPAPSMNPNVNTQPQYVNQVQQQVNIQTSQVNFTPNQNPNVSLDNPSIPSIDSPRDVLEINEVNNNGEIDNE